MLQFIQAKYFFTLLETTHKTSPVSPPSSHFWGHTTGCAFAGCELPRLAAHLIYISHL